MPRYRQNQRHKRGSLWEGLARALSNMEVLCSTELAGNVCNLVADMSQLEQRPPDDDLCKLVKSLIRRCANVSYSGGEVSLERQFKRVPELASVLETHHAYRRDILQVDKLARYWGLCRDLSKISRERQYEPLIRNIRVEPLTKRFGGQQPPGAAAPCFVHAEVQMVFHYEEYPPHKPPRAIGCSKSACYLCDLLIQKTGKYRISSSHRQLYNQWRMPDVTWMQPAQISFFRGVASSMTRDMARLEQAIRGGATGQRCQPTQSLAPLPLFTSATLSSTSLESSLTTSSARTVRPVAAAVGPGTLPVLSENENSPSKDLTPRQPPMLQPTSTLVSETLSLDSLPLKHICLQSPGLYLDLGDLRIRFEFIGVVMGHLHVRVASDGSASGEFAHLISALDIPTEDEIALVCSGSRPGLSFRLQHIGVVIEIEITWGAYSE